jgi:phosphoglycerol transferase MdoB-like AlkP superfamily enzyme
MQKFLEWAAKSPLAHFLGVFLAVYIGAAVADWSMSGEISLADWQVWVVAALVAAAPILVNCLNPQNTLYGVGSKSEA